MEINESTIPYLQIAKENYTIIEKNRITNDSLSRYFTKCFNDICRAIGLYKCWICVRCLELSKYSAGWGDKPKTCPQCGEKATYEVATFQARASYVGEMFQWAFWLLLKREFKIEAKPTSDTTRLYDLELRPDIVIEAKGSPDYLINPDGTHSRLGVPGMMRSDTKKKAFANAKAWNMRFPKGHFFVVTNAIPNELLSYRDDTIQAIYDVTKKNQLESLISDLKGIGIVGDS
jgi:hypothetical protein